jgi:MtaA/CmuA family methyltransferase
MHHHGLAEGWIVPDLAVMTMNERERLIRILQKEQVDRAPCICPMQTGILGLMQASGSFWPEAHHNPRKMADLALSAHRVAGLESARVPFEMAVDASAFGVQVSDRGLRRQPMVLERRIKSAEDFSEMTVPDPRKDGMVPIVLEAIKELDRRAPNLPVICGIMAPHVLAFELLGEQEALSMMANDPSLLKATLHKAKKFAIEYAEAASEAGADVIAFVDPLASGDFLSYQQYQEFAFPFHRKICDETEKLGIPVILHICGNTTRILPLMAQSGADGISIDSSVDVHFAKGLLSGKSAVIGNVSTTEILLHGTEDKVRACTAECVSKGVDAVAPGCGLVLQTPLNNLRAMVDTTVRLRGGGKLG